MALRGVFNQFQDTFTRLSLLQRVSLLAATIAVFATVVVLVLWANKPVYKTLYSDMSEQDVRDVSAALDGRSVPYRVVDGKSIEIPGADVYSVRIALAQAGLPKDTGAGFELFDDSKLGMTEFMQNVQYQRALQGELTRSIMAIDEVVGANVHLSIPKERIFMTEDDDSKASVVVRLMPGKTMRPEQVRAVTHLVAAAVRGLEPKNVQVLDTNGNLLSEFLSDDRMASYITQTQLEQQRKVEDDLRKKVQALLSRTLGTEKYVATVYVEMDFGVKIIDKTEYADTPVVRSSRNIETTEKTNGQGLGGIPGVESHLAEPDQLIDNIMRDYSHTDEITNYDISTTITHEEKNQGSISRMTVSVVVDDKHEQLTGEDGSMTISRVARSDEELSKIRNIVAAAVGYDSARGDVVDVSNISFDMSDVTSEQVVAQKEKLMEWVGIAAKYGAAVLILLLFYLLLVRPILKRLDNARELDDEMLGENALDAQLASLDIMVGDESGFPKSVEDLEREIESELNESVPVDVDAVKSKVMLKKIEEASEEDPEMVANLVKALIKGG